MSLVVMTTVLAHADAQYKLESDGTYTYTGTPVNELSVDFTTWKKTDLPDKLTDDNTLSEAKGMGFVKWKIAKRECGEKGTVLALFNDGNNDFGGENAGSNDATKNDANPIKPRIFLPTTSSGVIALQVFGGGGGVPMMVYYKDDDHADWTYAGELKLTMTYAEQRILLKSKGKTSIYLEYASRPWIAFTNLALEIGKSSDPNLPLGELDWEKDGSYWGDSVDYVYEDFTQWPMSALLAQYTEDIQQYKKLGFVRWKMERRAVLISSDQWSTDESYTSLFTNNPEINGFFTTDDGHHAKIFLPTLKHGAGAIRVTGYSSTQGDNAVSMQLGWFNEEWSEDEAGYTFIKSIGLPGDGSNVVESELNIEEPVTLQIAYHQSPYPTIYSIQISPYGFPLSDDPDKDFAPKQDEGQGEGGDKEGGDKEGGDKEGEGQEGEGDQGWFDVLDGTRPMKMMVHGQLIIVKKGQAWDILGNPVNL